MNCDGVPIRELSEAQHRSLIEILERVREEHRARLAALIEACGRPLASSGPVEDPEGLASLAASAVAASDRLASMFGEPAASLILQRGERDLVHIEAAAGFVVVVVFDAVSPQGLERLRARLRLKRALSQIASVLSNGGEGVVLTGVGEEEVEALLKPMAEATK